MLNFEVTQLHILALIYLSCASFVQSLQVYQRREVVNASELCIIPIIPSHMRWEKQQGSIKEIEYSARMSNSPDLPEWLKYSYDSYTSTGYIYGVPPLRLVTLNLDVIGWKRYDEYDVKQLIISLEIMRKEPMQYTMEMKIDNLNIKDLCVQRRMEDLKTILAEQLGWTTKDGNPVVPSYMASAVEIGENRVPLRPNEAEGVVIHFSSDKDFSIPLKKLQVEIFPLWKLRPCPRNLKRTSVERHFRRFNFLVDWCSFQLVSPSMVVQGSDEQGKKTEQKTTLYSSDNAVDETVEFTITKTKFTSEPDLFTFRSEIPERNYGYETLLATVLPGSIGGFIGIILISLLWADRDDESVDGDKLFFEAAFRMLFSIIRYNEGNNGGATNYAYRQINRQQQETVVLARDIVMKPEPVIESAAMIDRDREMMSTPLPPQYSETHPNGAPALIYAV